MFDLRLKDIHEQLVNKQLKVSDLVGHAITQIRTQEERVQAFITVAEEAAMTQASQMDEQLTSDRTEESLLFGIPAAWKDNIVTEGMRTTCASEYLADFNPIYDATVVTKMKEAGVISMGKLNLDEFAMGGSSENSAFHPTANPWKAGHVPGGSSSGSAAAVAAGEVYFSLGSDTGGSIRQPASYCGVVGLKPTYGLVSRFGLVAFASSLDQIGPITKNVEDAAYVLQAIAGYDAKDSTSIQTDIPNYAAALTGDVKGLRIALPQQYLSDGIQADVKAAVLKAVHQLEAMGAIVNEVSMPHTEYAIAAYYLLSSSEASSNLARFDGVRYGKRTDHAADLLDMYHKSRSEGFGPEVKRRIMLGTYALSAGYYDAYYVKAQQVRTLIKQDFDEVLATHDVIISPTTPTTAFKVGEQVNDPLTMYLNDACTIPVSLAGGPAISVPCGFSDGLPIGLQVIGKPFEEATVLRVAHAYEQQSGFMGQRPNREEAK